MCTNLMIKAKNNDVVVARSMDFASPTGVKTSLWTEGHKINKEFSVKIPFYGKYTEKDIGSINVRCVSDGFNQSGLSIGTLWLPSARLKDVLIPSGNEVSALVVPQILLGTCEDVPAAIKFLKSRTLVLPTKYINRFATLHFAMNDKHGNSVVVEFGTGVDDNGNPEPASTVHVYQNPVGVLTNAPEFPWQLRNLSNYTQIGLYNTESKKFGALDAKHTGFGANQLGLSGDASPPSRFVRAVTLMNAAIDFSAPADAAAATLLLDKVMGQVAVIQGTSADAGKKLNPLDKDKFDYTQWIVIKDLTHFKMLIKTAADTGFHEPKLDALGDTPDDDEIFKMFESMSDEQLQAFDESFGS